MKQVVQQYSTGKISVEEVPAPLVSARGVLVRNRASVVSAGTEKLMIELAKKSLLGKALARPDLAKQVIDKVRTEGLKEAFTQSMSRLDTPVPLGYSCAGEIIDVGAAVQSLSRGQRVACLGHPYASHAEIVSVPKNLVCPIPEGVSFEEASFVGVGAIALHGVRHAEVQLGDRVAVIGLGLLGLIAVQLLKAAGARVIGMDVDPRKIEIAGDLGMDAGIAIGEQDALSAVREFTRGLGADSVLIFASTRSNHPIELAGEIARERARIVAVGAVGLGLPRELYYHKELSLVVSRSWGPGIEDPGYERRGVDYPISYVRWTQQRNMEAFLEAVKDGKVDVKKLITHRFPFEDALEAYKLITGERKEPYIGIVLHYKEGAVPERRMSFPNVISAKAPRGGSQGPIAVGFIGAGLFAKSVLLPAVRGEKGVLLRGLSTASGSSGLHSAKKFGFEYCTTDYREILDDQGINTVFIATRHNLHAGIACEALCAGKNVFVEKPLATSEVELAKVYDVARESPGILMVGFNRRFSPCAVAAKQWLGNESGSMSIICRVNAGYVPSSSWVQDQEEGAGRIVGELCHFVDLVQYLAGSEVESVWADALGGQQDEVVPDNVHVNLRLRDGSVATIVYTAKGCKRFSRERVEVFRGESVCVIDNFRHAVFVSPTRRLHRTSMGVDRGHGAEVTYFLRAVRDPSIHEGMLESYVATTLTTFKVEEALKCRQPVNVSWSKDYGTTGGS